MCWQWIVRVPGPAMFEAAGVDLTESLGDTQSSKQLACSSLQWQPIKFGVSAAELVSILGCEICETQS